MPDARGQYSLGPRTRRVVGQAHIPHGSQGNASVPRHRSSTPGRQCRPRIIIAARDIASLFRLLTVYVRLRYDVFLYEKLFHCLIELFPLKLLHFARVFKLFQHFQERDGQHPETFLLIFCIEKCLEIHEEI